MENIMTVSDVAALLKVKEITVREMFRERRLRAFKMGKAWRTTETMLQEDIAAMARGETAPAMADPVEANTAAPATTGAKRGRKPRKAAEPALQPVAEEKPAPQPVTEEKPAQNPEPEETPPPKREKPQDPQQFLF